MFEEMDHDFPNTSQDALSRLTDKEKDCLRRRLQHQTAKEMALDLGISPHAVEKRLKMARMKLGVSSSLDAARMLEASELAEQGYGQTASQPSDLSSEMDAADKGAFTAAPLPETAAETRWPRKTLVSGAIAMSIIASVILAIAVQSAADAPDKQTSKDNFEIAEAYEPEAASSSSGTIELSPGHRAATMCEMGQFLGEGFDRLDLDHSGFAEPVEVSVLEPKGEYRDSLIAPTPPEGEVDQPAIDKWMPMLDTDRDNLVSKNEYVTYMMPWMLLQGVPEDWEIPEPNPCQD